MPLEQKYSVSEKPLPELIGRRLRKWGGRFAIDYLSKSRFPLIELMRVGITKIRAMSGRTRKTTLMMRVHMKYLWVFSAVL